MKIVSFKDRYAIADENGKIIDDCQGYGIKSYEAALRYLKVKEHSVEPEKESLALF